MDRCEAATTVLLWQMQDSGDLLAAVSRGGNRPLHALVEELSRVHPPTRRRPPNPPSPPPPGLDLLQLDEERELQALQERLRALAPVLRPEEWRELERRLTVGPLPAGRIAALRAELDRLGRRQSREVMERELEHHIAPPRPPAVRSLLLFARDGRLLASEGEMNDEDVSTFAALVPRREASSTFSLAHRVGFVVGHVGDRAALVVVFEARPRDNAPTTLRASVASLEKRDRLINAPSHPPNHSALTAYLRAVRVLLLREK